ncbi:unannotated protein [freshwater metagenome]|uniref:Unannotated protein n=1 Tax=freshwater metagenome TaxID=449393 RepID=A0A6J7L9A1_9ZZZZ|nr:hypothetical protein [Actinomycetota bacterium]
MDNDADRPLDFVGLLGELDQRTGREVMVMIYPSKAATAVGLAVFRGTLTQAAPLDVPLVDDEPGDALRGVVSYAVGDVAMTLDGPEFEGASIIGLFGTDVALEARFAGVTIEFRGGRD